MTFFLFQTHIAFDDIKVEMSDVGEVINSIL